MSAAARLARHSPPVIFGISKPSAWNRCNNSVPLVSVNSLLWFGSPIALLISLQYDFALWGTWLSPVWCAVAAQAGKSPSLPMVNSAKAPIVQWSRPGSDALNRRRRN